MSIGVLTLHLMLPGVLSLKEKRSIVKPVLSRLHREFNVSSAEVDRQDRWQEAVIACAIVSNDPNHCHRVLQQVVDYTEHTWPNVEVIDHQIELI